MEHKLTDSIYPRVETMQVPMVSVTPISYEQYYSMQAQQVQPLAVQAQWVQGAITTLMAIAFIAYSLAQILGVARGIFKPETTTAIIKKEAFQ